MRDETYVSFGEYPSLLKRSLLNRSVAKTAFKHLDIKAKTLQWRGF